MGFKNAISPYLLRRIRSLKEVEKERLRQALRDENIPDKYVEGYLDGIDQSATRH